MPHISGAFPLLIQPHKLLNDHCFIILKVFDPSLAITFTSKLGYDVITIIEKNLTFVLLYQPYGRTPFYCF